MSAYQSTLKVKRGPRPPKELDELFPPTLSTSTEGVAHPYAEVHTRGRGDKGGKIEVTLLSHVWASTGAQTRPQAILIRESLSILLWIHP